MCSVLYMYLSVPPPEVIIIASRSDPLYAGTPLNLTCTTTLDDSVNDGEVVNTVWTGPGLSSNRTMVTDNELEFRVLDRSDNGTYTCEVTVTPCSDRESSVSASPAVSRQYGITVLGEAPAWMHLVSKPSKGGSGWQLGSGARSTGLGFRV